MDLLMLEEGKKGKGDKKSKGKGNTGKVEDGRDEKKGKDKNGKGKDNDRVPHEEGLLVERYQHTWDRRCIS